MKTWKQRIILASMIALVTTACGDDDSTGSTATLPQP